MSGMTITDRVREAKYWYVTRKTRKIVPWIARHLPRRVKYYVVIDGMVTVEPDVEPNNVKGTQLLDLWEDKH